MQCLQTSEAMSQRNSPSMPGAVGVMPASVGGVPDPCSASASTSVSACRSVWATPSGLRCSMNATCRQVLAPSPTVLSYDMPVSSWPSSGTAFHSLHATSQALHPMHTVVSVKKPMRGGWST